MPKKLKLTIVSFHIIAFLFIFFAIVGFAAPFIDSPGESQKSDAAWYMYGSAFLLLAYGVESLISKLKQLKKWARIVSIGVAICLCPIPVFIIPAALALWGLFAKDTKDAFGLNKVEQ